MKTMKRDTDGMRCCGNTASANSMFKGRKCHASAPQVPYLAGLNAILAKAILLLLLLLAGGARPCGTLCQQRMVGGAWAVMS